MEARIGRFVSGLLVLVCVAALSGCYWVQRESTYIGPQVASMPVESTASLDWSDCLARGLTAVGCSISVKQDVDGKEQELTPGSKEYSRTRIPPGTYHVRVYQFFTDGPYRDRPTVAIQGEVELEQGHEYVVNKRSWKADITPRWAMSWWIEDAASREAVLGGKPPEHLPGFMLNPFGP